MTTRNTRNEFSPMWIVAIAVLLFVGVIYFASQQGSDETERPRRQSAQPKQQTETAKPA